MAESSFFVMVSGQVDSCTMLGVDTLYCRYSFRYGHDWTYMHVRAPRYVRATNCPGADSRRRRRASSTACRK